MYINDATGWLSDWDFADVDVRNGIMTTYAVFDAKQNCLAEFDTPYDAKRFMRRYPGVSHVGAAIRAEPFDSPADRTCRPKTVFFDDINTWNADKHSDAHYNKKFLEDFVEFLNVADNTITVSRDIPFEIKTRMQDYLTTSAYGGFILSKLSPQSYDMLINPEFF